LDFWAALGKEKAKFTDALWIAILGTVIADILNISLIVLLVWIALISHFFDCGLFKAIAIGIIAVVMLIVIAFILALIRNLHTDLLIQQRLFVNNLLPNFPSREDPSALPLGTFKSSSSPQHSP
jgi:hypothetical protein